MNNNPSKCLLFLLFFSSDIFLCLLTASPLPQCLLLDCFKNFLEKGILLEFPERIYLSLHQVPGEGGIILIQFHLLRCFKVSSGSCECYIPHLTLNLYFIFILLDYEKIVNGWTKLIPERYRPFIQELADDVEYNMNRYFRGQSLIALSVGILERKKKRK